MVDEPKLLMYREWVEANPGPISRLWDKEPELRDGANARWLVVDEAASGDEYSLKLLIIRVMMHYGGVLTDGTQLLAYWEGDKAEEFQAVFLVHPDLYQASKMVKNMRQAVAN